MSKAARADVVDAVFPVHGQALPRDHAQALGDALLSRFPWLAMEPIAAIHPIKLVHGLEPLALLSARARLWLRVPAHCWDELAGLAGLTLDVAGYPLQLGTPQRRELLPHSTLYAYRVAADSADEEAFMAQVGQALAQQGIVGQRVCGRHHMLAQQGQRLHAFSLMLHELRPEQSLWLQCHGLGPHRLLGCGVFVPHRSAAAVA